ncbi:C40 family peptidase [Myroides sp. M-43]|uniref:C40 family peptidase n=1 Tax=Myroides oncorhynchi TaxID=2893756 RepID=UPI001E489B2E|nr:C40 family peptidase [Myroides oncorhynchi]MCC9042505.1 C40 family peptidase [Myroides oncorhynchi]
MKKFTFLLIAILGLTSVQAVQAKPSKSKTHSVAKKPVKKKPVTVIAESRSVDADIQSDIDALLGTDIPEENRAIKVESSDLTSQVLSTAFDYQGVRYRYGGMSRSGIDCSGLVSNAFGDTNIKLPRSSSEMAQVGETVRKSEAQIGDLIFFKTRGNRISHVGIITEVLSDEIKFIHSSTSRGVIVSSTKENYYSRTFAQINRVFTDTESLN